MQARLTLPSEHLPTDAVLLRLHGTPPPWHTLRQRLAATAACQVLGATVGRCAWVQASGLGYVYLQLPERIALSHAALDGLSDIGEAGTPVAVARLALMHDRPGASQGQLPTCHYAVEMTPEPGWETELQQWYDREHLPGLASVPGCVHARRYWNHDDGPRSLACYDLVNTQTMGSAPWLQVRDTEWSSRMRPRFTGTVRTMFSLHAWM